jgi:hypothetical protein
MFHSAKCIGDFRKINTAHGFELRNHGTEWKVFGTTDNPVGLNIKNKNVVTGACAGSAICPTI